MFQEKQYFRQLWVILLFLGLNLFFLYGVIQQIIFGDPFGSNPASDFMLIVIWLFIMAFTWFFMIMSLKTQIDEAGIWFSFFPFLSNPRQVKWEEISSLNLRTCKPLQEFGGWGLRYGAKGIRAYTTSGRHGLEIHTHDGRKIFLGTQRPNEIESIVEDLKKDYLFSIVE